MPAVFVHGVPDTVLMWGPLISCLDRDDVITLSLPGFGCDVPEGFGSTKEEYAAWISDRLDEIGEPVDLVGHDWGCLLAQRVASVRPDQVRTLACGGGPIDVEYEWHPMAQMWQTPGVGEEIFAAGLALSIDDRVAGLVGAGSPPDLAAVQAEKMDARMGECILALYRSAITVSAEWQPGVEAMPARPSLVLWGVDDPYVTPRFAERLADRLRGRLVLFDGCSHWWPWERAAESAAALETLWASA